MMKIYSLHAVSLEQVQVVRGRGGEEKDRQILLSQSKAIYLDVKENGLILIWRIKFQVLRPDTSRDFCNAANEIGVTN